MWSLERKWENVKEYGAELDCPYIGLSYYRNNKMGWFFKANFNQSAEKSCLKK